jgi:hypothetical protein
LPGQNQLFRMAARRNPPLGENLLESQRFCQCLLLI